MARKEEPITIGSKAIAGKRLPKISLGALVTTGALLLVMVFVVIGLGSGAINRQLHAWKLLPEPERLTELYYNDHTHLPTQYTPGQSQQFSFTVHNLEYRGVPITYAYQVVQSSEDGSQSQTLAQGQFKLAQDGYHSQPIDATAADLGPRTQIVTKLTIPANTSVSSNSSQPAQQQMLHYWVVRTGTEGV